MRKLLLALILLLGTQSAFADAKIIHAVVNPTNGATGNITSYVARTPLPVLSGNSVLIWMNGASGVAPTGCADDKSNAYTSTVLIDNGAQRLTFFRSLGVTNGPQVFTCTWAAGHTYTAGVVFEVKGLASLDETCADQFVATFIDCTTAATDSAQFVIACGTQTNTDVTQTTWTPQALWIPVIWDTFDSSYCAYQIQPSAGVANPRINMGTNQSGEMIAMTFRIDNSGTDSTGMYPINMYHARYKTGDSAGVLNIACRGDENAVTVMWNGAAGRLITGTAPAINVSSTGNTGGTWGQSGAGSVFGGSGKNQFIWLQNTTCSAGGIIKITPTYSGGQSLDSMAIVMTWVNTATTLADASTPQSTTGTDATGAAFTGSTITASAAGYTFTYIGAATGAGSQVVCSPGTFVSPQTVPVIDTNPVGENQGACIKTIAASASYTVTWTPNSIAIGTYADYLVVINSAPAAGTGSKNMTLLGVGN